MSPASWPSLNMCTIPVDSRFINAIVFVLIDVVCFMIILSTFLQRLQTFSLAHLFRKGCGVRLRESRMSAFLPPILVDGQLLTRMLQAFYFALVAVFFGLTFSINGTTSMRPSVIHRRYVTQLQPATYLYTAPRLGITTFPECIVENEHSILYLPTAFDTVRNQTVSEARALLSASGQTISIDPDSISCQKFGDLDPLIRISPCGSRQLECDNIFWSNSTACNVEKDSDGDLPWEKTINVRVGDRPYGLLVFHLNLQANASHSSPQGDNRLICLERPQQGGRSSPFFVHFSCVLGKWDSTATCFSFRVGFGAVPAPDWGEHVENKQVPDTIWFTPFSSRIMMQFAAADGAEDALRDALGLVKEGVMSAREFMDGVFARAIVVREVSNDQRLLTQLSVPVTKIEAYGSWGYAVTLLISFVIFATQRCWLETFGLKVIHENDKQMLLNISEYSGVMKVLLLRHEGTVGNNGGALDFQMVGDRIRPVGTRVENSETRITGRIE